MGPTFPRHLLRNHTNKESLRLEIYYNAFKRRKIIINTALGRLTIIFDKHLGVVSHLKIDWMNHRFASLSVYLYLQRALYFCKDLINGKILKAHHQN